MQTLESQERFIIKFKNIKDILQAWNILQVVPVLFQFKYVTPNFDD